MKNVLLKWPKQIVNLSNILKYLITCRFGKFVQYHKLTFSPTGVNLTHTFTHLGKLGKCGSTEFNRYYGTASKISDLHKCDI